MALETVKFCPLGKECESVEDGKIVRCMWYHSVTRQNMETKETTEYDDCVLNVIPTHLQELKGRIVGVQAATESFRNQMVKINADNHRQPQLAFNVEDLKKLGSR